MSTEATDPAKRRSRNIALVGRPAHHRLAGLAAKSAIAAALAWKVGLMLPGGIAEYSYYAPLGALTVMYAGISDSVGEAARAAVAVSLGVLVALVLHAVAGPNAITVGLAIGVGILIGNVRVLGEQGSWVPLAALFVFTVHKADIHDYASAYVLQLVVGMIIGLVVNFALFPSLALHEVQRRASEVRVALIEALAALAEVLRHPGEQEHADRLGRTALDDLPERASLLREMTERSHRAVKANPRRNRWRSVRSDVLAYGESAQGAATLVEDLSRELLEPGDVGLNDRARSALAEAVDAVRATIEESRYGVTSPDLVADARERLDRVAPQGSPYFGLRAAHALRRCLLLTADWSVHD